jgi:hypothetical protein
MRKALKWVALGFVGLVVIAAIAGGGSSDSDKDGGSSDKASASETSSKKDAGSKSSDGCGTKATDDCTPHVGSSDQVRVDALIWKVRSAQVTKTIGDQTYGLGAKASGRFVVVKLKVHSDKDESAQLSDNIVKLEIDGATYDPDNDGTVALIGDGQQPFLLDTIGPDSDKNGTVVFDVPAGKLGKKIEVRFGELGFGETHGYIELPSLSV